MSSLFWYSERNSWYIQYRRSGKTIKKSLKTQDKKLASHMRAQIDLELGKIDAGLAEAMVNFGKAVDVFISERKNQISPAMTRRYEQMFYNVSKFLLDRGILHVQRVNLEVVNAYINHRRESGASPKTVKEEVCCVKILVRWLLDRGELMKSPVTAWPKLKTPVVKPETVGGYSREEIDKILAWFAGSPAESAVYFLAFTGARVGEAKILKVHDVHVANESVRITIPKTVTSCSDQFRHVEVHPRLAPILRRAILGKSQDDHVFPDLFQHRDSWVAQLIETCCRQLKMQYRRAHGLRHSWISRLLESGVPLAVVMKMAGHKNISTTQKYLHIGDQNRGWVSRL